MQAGLSFLLCDEAIPERAQPTAAAAPVHGATPATPATPAKPFRESPPPRSTVVPAPAAAPISPVSSVRAGLPAPWDLCWAKIGANRGELAPPWMVWTYGQLGRDLLETPDPGRRDVLRRLLQTLRWPAGSVVFWPLAVPKGSRIDFNIRMFWHGVRLLGAKRVCCFGQDCRAVLLRELAAPLPMEQYVLQYRSGKFLFLPDLESCSASLEPGLSSLTTMLRDHGPGA